MVVAAAAAAGVVGFGSAAVASPLDLGGATDSVPGVSQVKDRVTDGVAQTQELEAPGQAQLAGALSQLRGQLDGGQLNLDPQSADVSGEQLAVAVEDLAANIRDGSGKLSDAQAQGAERVAGQLETAAGQLRAASLQDSMGGGSASGEVAAEGSGGSVSGSGEMSSDGSSSVSAGDAFTQLESALAQVRQMDQQDVLGGSAGDVLDSDSAQAQLQRVAGQLNGLLG